MAISAPYRAKQDSRLTLSWRSNFDPRRAIVAQLYLFLRREIITLYLPPLHRLSEKELAEQLGISRTPVREALIRLSEEGLVDILPQRGTFISPIRISQVREAQFIRETLETAITMRAARSIDDKLISDLQKILRKQSHKIEDRDFQGFMDWDECLHQRLCDHCGLDRTWKMLQHVKGQLDRVRYLSLPNQPHLETLFQQHAQIVDALSRGDAPGASERMSIHLQEVFRTIDLLIDQRPDIFEVS